LEVTAEEKGVDYYHRFIAGHFSERLPRYTSYPTAVHFSKEFNREEILLHFFETLVPGTPTSLYVHLPYCAELCYFCACNKIISRKASDRDDYLSLLKKEVELHFSRGLDIRELHFGGGTPNAFNAAQLDQVCEMLEALGSSAQAKKSIELDCRTVDKEQIKTLRNQGFRRFSLGVQDLDADVQRIIHRNQSEASVRAVVESIREIDGSSINFDLIYGLPAQTLDSFTKTIEKTIEIRPERIALYGYAQVQWRVKVQRALSKWHTPNFSERLELFSRALNLFQSAGYRYIGLDHFALPDDQLSQALDSGELRRNFMGYTTQSGEVLLGLGLSAISDTGRALIQKSSHLADYRRALDKGEMPIERVILRSEEDQVRAYCIEALMCRRRLSLAELMQAFPECDQTGRIFQGAAARITSQIPRPLADIENEEIRVSELGSLFVRFIASTFDAYLEASGENAFSSAV